MLVLSRKTNEEIVIGNNVTVKVVRIEGNKVRLAISAPTSICIRRGELPDRKEFDVELDSILAVTGIPELVETARPRSVIGLPIPARSTRDARDFPRLSPASPQRGRPVRRPV